jgi:uncharacterized protein YndB with AHSA1/START domain
MSQVLEIKPANDRELVLSRLLDAPRANVYRCWTEPALLRQWFAPKPWTTPIVDIDPRPGGALHFVMRGPNGEESDNPGVFLAVAPNEKIVMTDAFLGDWAPREGAPFMVAEITFADQGGKTRYTARVRHWTVEAKEQHEKMGFHAGWGVCADQLEALARTL